MNIVLWLVGFLAGILFWPRIFRWAYIASATFHASRSIPSNEPVPAIYAGWLLFTSAFFLILGLTVATLLAITGGLSSGWTWFLIGIYAALALFLITGWRLLRRTRRPKPSPLDPPTGLIHWAVNYPRRVVIALALIWVAPMMIFSVLEYPHASLRALLFTFLVASVGGAFMSTVLWFTIIRVAVDDYKFRKSRAERDGIQHHVASR